MTYSVVHAGEITADLVARWAAIQQADSSLASPYFRPEFTQAVAAVRDDVFVGLLQNGDRAVGFFPFHRRRGGIAHSVGLGLSDYHGIIADPAAEWTAEDLLRGCGIVRWEFDHLPASQHQFAPYHASISDSPIIEVSQGMDVFEASRDKSGRKQIREVRRRREKLSEQIGPVRFAAHSDRQDVLRKLLDWKSDQCRRTGTVDFFALDWCAKLIEYIHHTREPGFGGILACLYAGDTLAAVHFAMYSREVWHSWFPAYNHDLEMYSPGFILLLELIRAAADRGVQYIDLGKGLSLYKKRVMTGGIPVAEGCVALPSFINRLHDLGARVEEWGKQSPLKAVLRIPGRIVKNRHRRKRYD